MKPNDRLVQMDACAEAVAWVAEHGYSLRQAWRRCQRGDWMLWWATQVGVDRARLVWVACQCARLALRYVRDGEDRPRIAIETAEAWTRGDASLEDVRTAAAAAYYAADYAYYAAAYAAYVAPVAAPYAVAIAADDQANALAECARIVRREWPTLPEDR